jgi:hypothetical protein
LIRDENSIFYELSRGLAELDRQKLIKITKDHYDSKLKASTESSQINNNNFSLENDAVDDDSNETKPFINGKNKKTIIKYIN